MILGILQAGIAAAVSRPRPTHLTSAHAAAASKAMATEKVHVLPILSDNYAYVIDGGDGSAVYLPVCAIL